ncbi:MAG: DUF4059 family protein [Streptococcaceae bacterium]|nr:DUF4059 family protein [Streptococcaceae bacterium]
MKLLMDLYLKGLLFSLIFEIVVMLVYLLLIHIHGQLKRREFQKLILELILVLLSTVPILSFAYIAVSMILKARNLA